VALGGKVLALRSAHGMTVTLLASAIVDSQSRRHTCHSNNNNKCSGKNNNKLGATAMQRQQHRHTQITPAAQQQ